MAQTYFGLLTTIGENKDANAKALGLPLVFTELSVGDGNGVLPIPDKTRNSLVNQTRRAPINAIYRDESSPNQVVIEQIIPENVGGWWIREMGLWDEDGDLIAICNCPPSYKPQLAEGSGRTQVVRMVLIFSSAGTVQLRVDSSTVLAPRSYVDSSIATAIAQQDAKQSVRAATTQDIEQLSGLLVIDGVQLVAGNGVLVKNQTNAANNGIYTASAQAWSRRTDADSNVKVSPGLMVYVEEGNAFGRTVWKLVTKAPIALNTTALTFRDINDGYAPVTNPVFQGTSIGLPNVETADLPTVPPGHVLYNSERDTFEGMKANGQWEELGGAARGSNGNKVFFENDQTVTDDYTITAGKNAMVAGPLTIADGVTVTIPDGSTLTIV